MGDEFNQSLQVESIAAEWHSLVWATGELVLTKSLTRPLRIKSMPATAGLYRMTWRNSETWAMAGRSLSVNASRKIPDPILDLSGLKTPFIFTIGRTTNLSERIQQHFGTNQCNNRVISRVRQLYPHLPGSDLSRLIQICLVSITIEWVENPSWLSRCLLEKYGTAIMRPIFDMDAEH